ncbi:MAG: outer membrane protein assembly factor BamD [candidate division WOR-3 bacterium]|nr:outer membrane protein assembly factor BamD [candidate division WOR-3 bacterium]
MKRLILISLISLIVVTGCSKKTRIEDPQSPDEKTIYEEALQLYENEDWSRASDAFQRYVFSYPASNLTQKAQYYLADANYQMRNWSQSIIEFKYFVNNYRNVGLREDSYYKLAFSYYYLTPSYQFDQTLTLNAIAVIEDFKMEFPQSEKMAEIDSIHRILLSRLEEKKFHTANFYLKRRDNNAAEIYLEDIQLENMLPEMRDRVIFTYGSVKYNLEKYDEAKNILLMLDEESKYFKRASAIISRIPSNSE